MSNDSLADCPVENLPHLAVARSGEACTEGLELFSLRLFLRRSGLRKAKAMVLGRSVIIN